MSAPCWGLSKPYIGFIIRSALQSHPLHESARASSTETMMQAFPHASHSHSLGQALLSPALLEPYCCCRGFPPPIASLKRQIEASHPGLDAENPGSRWPKTSLGALKDDKRLTPDQLKALNAICERESVIFTAGMVSGFNIPAQSRGHNVFPQHGHSISRAFPVR